MLSNFKRLTLVLMLVSLSGILLTACSQNVKETSNAKTTGPAANVSPATDGKTATTADTANQITIQNFTFKPANLTVAPGTKVTWINKDSDPHTATSTNKSFNSNALDTDEQFSFVFNDKGDFAYFCALHPMMKGQITVK